MADVEGTGCLGLGPDLLATYDIASGALPDLPVVVQAVAARGLMGVGDSVRRRQEFGREIAAGRLGPPGGVVAGVAGISLTRSTRAHPSA